MKRNFSTHALAIIGCILFVSCEKSDDSNNNSNSSANSWKLGTTTYNAIFIPKLSARAMAAFDSIPNSGTNPTNANSVLIMFGAAPAAGGTFKIVNGANQTFAANEVSVSAKLKTSIDSYISTGYDNINLTLTMVNGKMKVEFPDVWVRKFGTSDSLKLTANITEQ
jgi:hypothetical protein